MHGIFREVPIRSQYLVNRQCSILLIGDPYFVCLCEVCVLTYSQDIIEIMLKGNPRRIQDFVLGGTKVGERSGDRLRSPASPGQNPGRGPRGRSPPPRKLLSFEYLGSFSVNNFEAFCDEVY